MISTELGYVACFVGLPAGFFVGGVGFTSLPPIVMEYPSLNTGSPGFAAPP